MTLTEKAKDIVGFKIEELTSDKLDAFALEIIKEVSEEEPETIKPSLLENINQVIEQKKEEAKQKEQERIVQEENQIIVFDQEVIQTSPVNNNWSSSSGSNDSSDSNYSGGSDNSSSIALNSVPEAKNGKIKLEFSQALSSAPLPEDFVVRMFINGEDKWRENVNLVEWDHNSNIAILKVTPIIVNGQIEVKYCVTYKGGEEIFSPSFIEKGVIRIDAGSHFSQAAGVGGMKPKEGNTLFFEYGYNDIPFCLHISNEETYPVSWTTNILGKPVEPGNWLGIAIKWPERVDGQRINYNVGDKISYSLDGEEREKILSVYEVINEEIWIFIMVTPGTSPGNELSISWIPEENYQRELILITKDLKLEDANESNTELNTMEMDDLSDLEIRVGDEEKITFETTPNAQKISAYVLGGTSKEIIEIRDPGPTGFTIKGLKPGKTNILVVVEANEYYSTSRVFSVEVVGTGIKGFTGWPFSSGGSGGTMWLQFATIGESRIIGVRDLDLIERDEVAVHVKSETDLTGFQVTLTKDVYSESFTGEITFTDESNASLNEIGVKIGDTVTITYIDELDEQGEENQSRTTSIDIKSTEISNGLENLSIEDWELGFETDKMDYDLFVNNDSNEVTLTATTINSKYIIWLYVPDEGSGRRGIQVGSEEEVKISLYPVSPNIIHVLVLEGNKFPCIYTITINRTGI